MRTRFLFALFTSLSLLGIHSASSGQSRVNGFGTGGIHTIQGRVYMPNGKSADSSIIIRLESTNFSTITVNTDYNGGFAFRSLAPGNYTVVVEGNDYYETTREYVTIEPNSNVRAAPMPKVFTLPMYLVLKRSGELQKRAEVFHAKWASIPRETTEHFERGLEFEQAGKSAEAEVEFRKAIELSPNFSPAHTELGKIALKNGKAQEAVEACKTAIRYDDADFDAHLNLGMAYISLKQLDLAEPELVGAAFIDRTAVTPHYYLGIIYVMKNNLDIAQKAFETAKGLSGGGLPTIHLFLGRIYLKKDREREGLQELEMYLKLSPKAQDAEKVKKEISDIKAKMIKNAFA